MKVVSLVLLFASIAYSAEYSLCKIQGSVSADPVFNGFHHQRFEFTGKADNIYHIFSDEHIMVNSLFGYAKKHQGTIMKGFGVMLEGFNISFDTETVIPHKSSCLISINGVNQVISEQPYYLNDCILLTWDARMSKVQIRSPHYDLIFYSINKKNGHIYEPYFDFIVDRNGNDKSIPLGGVLGQTSVRHNKISTKGKDFQVTELFDTYSVKNKYRASHYACNKTSSTSGQKSRALHVLRLEDNGCPTGEYCLGYTGAGQTNIVCSTTPASGHSDCLVPCNNGGKQEDGSSTCGYGVSTNGDCVYPNTDFDALEECMATNYCNTIG